MTEKAKAASEIKQLKSVIEAALMASEVPLSVRKIRNMFEESERPETTLVNKALKAIEKDCASRGIELRQIGKGYRFQTKDQYAGWLRKLRDTRPPRYSRALIETLSIIAYRQPVTRGDIEGIRGVAVSSDIMRTLLDREWISQVGHRDVPGRPALYATTDSFLEYFNLRSLSELPALMEPRDVTDVAKDLNITLPMAKPDLSAGADVLDEESISEETEDGEAEQGPDEISLADLSVGNELTKPALDDEQDEDDDDLDDDDENEDDFEDEDDDDDDEAVSESSYDSSSVVALDSVSTVAVSESHSDDDSSEEDDQRHTESDSNVVNLSDLSPRDSSIETLDESVADSESPDPIEPVSSGVESTVDAGEDSGTVVSTVAPLNVDFSEFDSLPPELEQDAPETDEAVATDSSADHHIDESAGSIQTIHTPHSDIDSDSAVPEVADSQANAQSEPKDES